MIDTYFEEYRVVIRSQGPQKTDTEVCMGGGSRTRHKGLQLDSPGVVGPTGRENRDQTKEVTPCDGSTDSNNGLPLRTDT